MKQMIQMKKFMQPGTDRLLELAAASGSKIILRDVDTGEEFVLLPEQLREQIDRRILVETEAYPN